MTQITPALSATIIVSSGKVWRWQFDLIQSLIAKNILKINDVMSDDSTELSSTKSIALLQKCDAAIFRSPLNAFELVDANKLSEQVISSDGSAKSDILINFTESKVDLPKIVDYEFGLIEIHFSAEGALSSQLLAISEYLNQERQVYLAVSSTDSAGNNKTLYQAKPSLDKGSLTRNLNQYFQLMDAMWLTALKRLKEKNTVLSNVNDEKNTALVTDEKLSSPLVIPKLSQRFASNVADKLLQKYKRHEQWVLLLQFRSDNHADEMPLHFDGYIELVPPADVFWADPFVITEESKHFVFFEELPFDTERGHLSCMEVFEDGTYSTPQIILKKPFHLSFPNVFKHDATYYMIPESGDNGTIDLYRCTDFPYQWERAHTLIDDLHAYDSTLLERDGQWWLFATVAAEKGMSGNEELHIFYSDSPVSNKWMPHQANPVISDASVARPAGKFFNIKGEWFRPSQDCAGHYGAGLNINKIIQLDESKYVEEKISCSRPDWKESLIALHTLNFNNDVAVADALRVTPKGIF